MFKYPIVLISQSSFHFVNVADKSGKGKKKERVAGVAGGAGADLAKIAAEQQEKVKRDMEAAMEAAKKAQEDRLLLDSAAVDAADAAAKQRALDRAAAAEKAAREAAEKAARDAEDALAAAAAAAAAAATAALEAALAAANRPGATKEEIEAAEALAKAAAEAAARAAAEAAARAAAEAAAKAGAGEEGEGEAVPKKRIRDGPLVPDTVIGIVCSVKATLNLLQKIHRNLFLFLVMSDFWTRYWKNNMTR